MIRWLSWAALAGLALAFLGFLVASSGLISLKASSGHWQITELILKYGMRRSVATHSVLIDAPGDLDDPARVRRGAGHYESGCAFCHGAPGRRMPRVPAAMTPHPPPLTGPVRELDAEELFYVVDHGVKFTAMPAWPARHRPEEVWDMVAFLIALRDLDAAGYQALVRPEAPAPATVPEVVAERCVRCHGVDGLGRGAVFPRLAGQRRAYLESSLTAYATGARPSGVMEPIAADLDPEQIRAAADYYAALPPPPALEDPGELVAAGAVIAHKGVPAEKLAACAGCHGPSAHPHHDTYPLLGGQPVWYLERQLELFRAGHRGGTEWAELMHEVATAHDLDDDQIAAVARYYASISAR